MGLIKVHDFYCTIVKVRKPDFISKLFLSCRKDAMSHVILNVKH